MQTIAVCVALLAAVTLVAGQNSPTSGDSNKSLGDIAREVRPKDVKTTSQRVFTDEDVKHGSQPPLPDPSKTGADYRTATETYLQDAEKYADKLSAKTARQLGEIVAKDIQFLGRDAWEKQLANSRDALVTSTRTAAFTVRRAQTLSEGSDIDGAKDAHTVVQEQLNRLRSARRDYERVLADGADKAAAWEKNR